MHHKLTSCLLIFVGFSLHRGRKDGENGETKERHGERCVCFRVEGNYETNILAPGAFFALIVPTDCEYG
jgi:hypothetical protein